MGDVLCKAWGGEWNVRLSLSFYTLQSVPFHSAGTGREDMPEGRDIPAPRR